MLKNMKIGKKLILTFVLVAVISCIGGIVGFVVTTNIDSSYKTALTNYGFSQGDIGNFNAKFASSRSTIKDLILYTDQQSIQTASDKLDKTNTEITQYLTAMQKQWSMKKKSITITVSKMTSQNIWKLKIK